MDENAHKKLQQLFDDGPFPGRIDPWAEVGTYFTVIHTEFISHLVTQTKQPLYDMGYMVGREKSLQVSEGCIPDLHILRKVNQPERFQRWNYDLAAAEVLAEPGEAIEDDIDLQALHIYDTERGDLVTVVEVVSPTNKMSWDQITDYQERRSRLFLERGVNVVEVDMTRSVKHLVNNALTSAHPYHVALFLPGEFPRIVGIEFEQQLSRIALPLRGEVLPIELQAAYTYGYNHTTTAWHIEHDKGYTENKLPFPSLLTDQQRQEALAAVAQWQAEVQRLQAGG